MDWGTPPLYNGAVQNQGYRYFAAVTAVFVTCLVTANIIAVKIVDVLGIVVPAAVVIFPISYIFGDILTEVYGYARARQVIWIGFACNALAVLAIWVGESSRRRFSGTARAPTCGSSAARRASSWPPSSRTSPGSPSTPSCWRR